MLELDGCVYRSVLGLVSVSVCDLLEDNAYELNRGVASGFLGYDLPGHKAIIYGSGDVRFSSTTLSTIGAAVAGVLRKPEETANRYIFIYSSTTTGNELLAALEKATGKKWDVEHKTIEETIKTGREKVSKNDFSGMAELIVASIFGGNPGSDFTADQQLANKLLGLPEETLDEIVAKIVNN